MRRLSRFAKPVMVAAAAFGLLITGGVPRALADAYYDGGLQFFRKRDYQKAMLYFAQSYRTNPGNADAVYYQALCQQYLGRNQAAVGLYASVLSNFPQSNTSAMAAAALERLDPRYYAQLVRRAAPQPQGGAPAPASAGGGNPELASLPNQSKCYFHRDGALIVIDASVNNRPTKMIFDTGAEMVAIGKNHLDSMGIKGPSGGPTGQAAGVGSAGTISTWNMRADVKVGGIDRKNFPVTVQESMAMYPLLGQSFFRDFIYTIDYTNADKTEGSINFIKRGAQSTSSSGPDRYAVPFTREGNELIVQVDVNGKTIPMYFDTGASGITFSMQQLQKMNVAIPDDATPEMHQGIGGTSAGFAFNIGRMRCGPIDKQNVHVSATESANMRYPLLGQTFYGDWQYTIDNAANLIRFVRR